MSIRSALLKTAIILSPLAACAPATQGPQSQGRPVIQFHPSTEFDRGRDQHLHDWAEASCRDLAARGLPPAPICATRNDKGSRPTGGVNDNGWYNETPIPHGDVVITRPMPGTTDPYFPPQLKADYCANLTIKNPEVQADCLRQQQQRNPDNTLPAVPLLQQPVPQPAATLPPAYTQEMIGYCIKQSWLNEAPTPLCESLNRSRRAQSGQPLQLAPVSEDQPINCLLPGGSTVRLVLRDCRARDGLRPTF